MARDWVWIDAETARAIHAEQIAEHGSPAGVRDDAGLESAMARARNLALPRTEGGGEPDDAALAAAYAYRITSLPPIVLRIRESPANVLLPTLSPDCPFKSQRTACN